MQFRKKMNRNKIAIAMATFMMTLSLTTGVVSAYTHIEVNNTQAGISSTQEENVNNNTNIENVIDDSSVSTERNEEVKSSTEVSYDKNDYTKIDDESSRNVESTKTKDTPSTNPENAKEENSTLEVEDFNVAIKKSANFNGFVFEDGKWYFYSKGERKKGWIEYNGVKYYILKTYQMPQNMWRMIKGYKYYFNKDGVMIRDQKISIDGTVYQFDKDGHQIPLNNSKKLGEVSPEQKAIYEKGANNLKESISNKRVGIIKEDGKWYKYVDGKKTRGWYQENGKTYYFLNTYNRAENMWRKIKGKLYYFGSDGVRYENVIRYIGSDTYKFNMDGSLDENAKTTIVLKDVSIREKADNNSKVYWNLKKGNGVVVIQRLGNFVQVQTADGAITGWIPKDAVMTLRQEKVSSVIALAKSKLGSPYVWGATGPSTFDCSGFMLYIFKHGAGITLPRVSKNQATVGTYVPREQLKPGDLVFWGNPIHHVAMYIGDGKYIHAPEPGDYVRIVKLGGYTTARRVIN